MRFPLWEYQRTQVCDGISVHYNFLFPVFFSCGALQRVHACVSSLTTTIRRHSPRGVPSLPMMAGPTYSPSPSGQLAHPLLPTISYDGVSRTGQVEIVQVGRPSMGPRKPHARNCGPRSGGSLCIRTGSSGRRMISAHSQPQIYLRSITQKIVGITSRRSENVARGGGSDPCSGINSTHSN
jgi:hypothetical protein